MKNYSENFIQAGKIAKEVRVFGKSLVKPGASYYAIYQAIINKTHEMGAIPAFPPQMALNDVAAHFLPQPDEDIIFKDQIVKLDIGVCYKGAIGDCAVTIDLSGKNQALVDAVEAALLAAEKIICVGLPIREIGKIIETTIQSKGFKPIKNLSGHGLGFYQIHTDPTIPNYDNRCKDLIKPGMTFAIEPFATNGKGLIYDGRNPTLFSFESNIKPETEVGKSLLKKIIADHKRLPFALYDLISPQYSLPELKFGLAELIKKRAIVDYPPLIEEEHGLVAQAENSVLIDERGVVTVTTR